MTAYLWRCDLTNWVLLRVTYGDHPEYIQGEVVQDNRGRFAPGDYVYSTEINKKVGNWKDLDTPDEGRHVQTEGDSHYYPQGPGQILEVPAATAERIRAGASVREESPEFFASHAREKDRRRRSDSEDPAWGLALRIPVPKRPKKGEVGAEIEVLFFREDRAAPKRIRFDDLSPALEQTLPMNQLYRVIRAAERACCCYRIDVGNQVIERLEAWGDDLDSRVTTKRYIERQAAFNVTAVTQAIETQRV